MAGSTLGDVYEDALRQPIPQDAIIVGSGFFVQPSLVLTSAHVLAGCLSIMVESPTIPLRRARREALFKDRDIALLKVEGLAVDYLPLAASAPSTGLTIYGYPAGRTGASRPLSYAPYRASVADDALLLWGPNVPAGVSGGPIVNGNGEAVALITGRVNSSVGRELLASPLGMLRGEIGDVVTRGVTGKADPERATVKVTCK